MPASPSVEQIAALQQAMDPSLLVPDRTVVVAPSGSVDVAFDLPRFGVSLVTILPAAGASDGGTDTDGGDGSPGISGNKGCTCRVGGRGNDAGNSAAWLGVGVLILVAIVRRRSARIALSNGSASGLARICRG
jgi:MYXO-CTERM domain-containing protein